MKQSGPRSLEEQARQALANRNWEGLGRCASELIVQQESNADGYLFLGLAEAAHKNTQIAIKAFMRCLSLDDSRYDAAVELSSLYVLTGRNQMATDLLEKYSAMLNSSPKYLFMAAKTYSSLGLHERAWPLYQQADCVQPGVDSLLAELAACATKVGEIDRASEVYRSLLIKHPQHQRNHYELSRLKTAEDDQHVRQMKNVLASTPVDPARNIFINYALGKELEDLEQWDAAFEHYQAGGNAAAGQCAAAGYRLSDDVQLIDSIIETCTAEWIGDAPISKQAGPRQPIFVLGLPRSGTTLTEKIISSHSLVESADESFFLQMAIQRAGSAANSRTPDIDAHLIRRAADSDVSTIGEHYLESIAYRLGEKPQFVEKYPFNFLYLGFIAKALPGAQIVLLDRNPMDVSFAMFKQPYFKFAYTLQDLATYYQAYRRLVAHWQSTIEHLYVLPYERLVGQPEMEIPLLLDQLGLEFEQACIDFHLNPSSSATASSVQIRQQAHTRSVGKWQNWAQQLQPLSQDFTDMGIDY